MIDGNLDQALLLQLNTAAGPYPRLYAFADNALFRGFPIFFALVSMWFIDDCGKRRSRMLAGLLGVCFATVLSVWCQVHFDVHTRPLIDTSLRLQGVDDLPWTRWDRASSFPSDTATLYFGLVAVVFLENRLVGLFCLLWATVVIAIPRVAFGLHYPTDMIGSLILGPACVFLFSKLPYPRLLFERALKVFSDRMHLIHALLFIFLAETSNVFQSLQAIGIGLVKMMQR